MSGFRSSGFFNTTIVELLIALATTPIVVLVITIAADPAFGRKATCPGMLCICGLLLIACSVLTMLPFDSSGVDGWMYFFATQGIDIAWAMAYVWSAELF